MTTQPNTLRMDAFYNMASGNQGDWIHQTDKPTHATFGASFATVEEAEALVALFPKGAGLRTNQYGGVYLHVTLKANGINGGINEAGVKRIRRILSSAAKNGVTIDYHGEGRGNFYPTLDTFLAVLDTQVPA